MLRNARRVARRRETTMGRVLYVMGASGVGKDSLIAALRPLQPDWPVAHRYITRASGDSENCVTLSDAEYAWRRDAGLFCLHWQAHGLSYALGIELEAWLERCDLVIVNGSRAQLAQARERFGERLLPLLVQADPQVIRQRLIARGRESAAQVEERLARSRRIEPQADVLLHDNDAPLAQSVAQLHRRLRGLIGG